MKIAIVMTEPLIVRQLMKGQLKWLNNKKYKITVICSDGKDVEWIKNQGADHLTINFARKINLLQDIKCIFFLISKLKKLNPDIIHFSTPKSSLLTPLAIKLGLINARVVYTVRGRFYENYNILAKSLYKLFDLFSCYVADKVIFISNELEKEYTDFQLVKKNKSIVINKGSSNGFDLKYFRLPTKIEKVKSKKFFRINKYSKIIAYIGRIDKDKGIEDLLITFNRIKKNSDEKQFALLIVGSLEMNLNELFLKLKITKNNIFIYDWIDDIRKAYWASDVLLFPSYREGFGNACIESILCGSPVVSYNIIGCRESVNDKNSGFLVPFKDKEQLYKKTKLILDDSALRKGFVLKGSSWARSNFDHNIIWEGIENIYKNLV